jgi:hypothetical protein
MDSRLITISSRHPNCFIDQYLGDIIILYSLAAINANSSCLEDCCSSLQPRAPATYYYYQNTGRFRGGSGDWVDKCTWL